MAKYKSWEGGVYSDDQKEYSLSAGDVFLFGSDEVHCLTDISDGFLILSIHFKPNLLWSDSDAFFVLRLFFARSGKFENRLARNEHTRALHESIVRLTGELFDRRDSYARMVKYILFSSLLTIVREYDYID